MKPQGMRILFYSFAKDRVSGLKSEGWMFRSLQEIIKSQRKKQDASLDTEYLRKSGSYTKLIR